MLAKECCQVSCALTAESMSVQLAGSPKLHMASMEASPPTTPKSGFNPPPDTELLYCYEKMGEIEGMEHCAYSEMYLSPTPTTQFRQR